MISRKRFNSRRVFLLHGVLLLAVLVVAFFSGRAQYQTVRDQQLERSRGEQVVTARTAAQLIEQNIRLLAVALPGLGDEPGTTSLLPRDWLKTVAKVNRSTGAVEPAIPETQALASAIARNREILRATKPTLAIQSHGGECDLLLAAPMIDSQWVRVGLLDLDQISADLNAVGGRPVDGVRILGTEDLTVLIGNGRATPGELLSKIVSDEAALKDLRLQITAGTVGTSTARLAADQSPAMLTVQPLNPLPGVRWFVMMTSLNQERQVAEILQPLLWQLVSGASMMVAAVAIVLLSTTISLQRGRRRIEGLRMDMLNRDLQKARRIQLNWLPAPRARTPHFEIAAENQPASHISGDFYNWFELPGYEDDPRRRTVVVIGDVSGHGLPAAFLMATTQMIVKNTMPRLREPGACLSEVNRQLCSLVYSGQFVTMMILVVDQQTGAIEIASAGQAPPLRKREGVEILPIDPQLVVGVDPTVEYVSHRIESQPADILLLYTDGVVEATDDLGLQFGLDNLRASLRAAPANAAGALHSVLGAVAAHRQGNDAEDDVTLVLLQLLPVPVVQAAGT